VNAQPGDDVASSGSATETPCAAGTYQPNPGASSCLEAGVGYYVPTSGATSETMCPAGDSSNPGATSCTAKPTIKKFKPAKAKVGKKVTITGTNLSGALSVKFNGTPAAITTDTATKITTKVPAGATTGVVTVTTAGGTATSTKSFKVT
jgi:hypothetical protein